MNNEKEFSLVVYGASGFTGRLVAEYLAAQYGDNLKWAMAGRNEEKLKSVREEVGAGDVPLIIADSDDEASLKSMVARTDVVLTTTGPYQLYGEGLLKACAEAGTHYVDL